MSEPGVPTKPATETGRRLAGWRGGGYVHSEEILAIEAEAREAAEMWWASRYAAAHRSNDAGFQAAREMTRRANEILAR